MDGQMDGNRRCTSCSGEQADGNRRCTSGSGEQMDGNRRCTSCSGEQADENRRCTSGSEADEGRKGVQIWGEFQQVRLTGEEREKLDRRIGRSEARQLIDRLDRWLAQGNVRRNHYATLLQWADRDAARRPDKPDRPASYDIEEAARTLGGL